MLWQKYLIIDCIITDPTIGTKNNIDGYGWQVIREPIEHSYIVLLIYMYLRFASCIIWEFNGNIAVFLE